ncbi:hypothetical protein C8R43DRAFT_1066887 [Mycena crocata]|nr:hypothetical protein C8R43DRAFT_1066887 [Mycena crocata]
MKFPQFTQLLAVAVCALHVAGGPLVDHSVNSTVATGPAINIGTGDSGSTYVWVSGQNRCSAKTIQAGSGNFCGISFGLQVLPGVFDFEGCGGPLWVNQDGAFYANCQSFSEDRGCLGAIKTTFTCIP